MLVKCPRCGVPTEYTPENPHRPFCSKRCKDSDLFDWLTELEDPPPDDDANDPDAPLPASSSRTRQ